MHDRCCGSQAQALVLVQLHAAEAIGVLLLNEAGGQLAAHESGVDAEVTQERHVVADTVDDVLVQLLGG